MNNKDWIEIKGAREHNLKNVNLKIPKNKLIVFTGLSGSGKSSLAFTTIYSEGRRRYIESLSSYARQFLGGNEKPDVDSITGLSPAISIDQKTTSHNPRSTAGTVTEVYDYLRILFARIGTPYCINGHGTIRAISIKEMLLNIKQQVKVNSKIILLAPVIRDKKGTHKDVFLKLKKNGFIRVKVDGEIKSLDEEMELNQNERHNIDIVVDRIVYNNSDEIQARLHEAIEIGLNYSSGIIKIENFELDKTLVFSSSFSCKECNFTIPEIEPRLFSFNAPNGACYECNGLGMKLEIDEELLIPNKNISINDGAIKYFKNFVNTKNVDWQRFKQLLDYYNISVYKPIKELSAEQMKYILRGSDEPIQLNIYTTSGATYSPVDYVEGIADLIERRYAETNSNNARDYYLSYMSDRRCNVCEGQRLNKIALSVKINNISISDFTKMSIADNLNFILNVELTEQQHKIASLVLQEITNRLDFLNKVGLGYLSLSRSSQTLSGGEAQRIRLATQIGAKLTGVLYVLDEPSIGLHQRDNTLLIETLKNLRDLGNTVIVVEHDEETIRAADWIVDIGPLAGSEGGTIISNGTLQDAIECKESITGKYLNYEWAIETPKKRRGGNGKVVEVIKVEENNLNKINVKIPLNKFICLTGVSGSGKSTLLNEILYKGIRRKLNLSSERSGKFESIHGLDNIDKVIYISQDPIGKTPRSNPATYTSTFDDIRDLFAETRLSKSRGYLKGRFSFNVPGGRCEHCSGDGIIKISMQFLPTVYVVCEVCDGKRYNEETLLVKYKNKSIYDILEMTVNEACEFFENNNKIIFKLKTLKDVGLGYIKLGQSAPQLSGGEAQRIKLSTYLQKKGTGKTLFLLDEPTTGLHIHDVKKLLNVLNRILDNGNTVICIEHNLDVIKCADYLIDLGPEGGNGGGNVVATGTPEQVADNPSSFTGQYLKEHL